MRYPNRAPLSARHELAPPARLKAALRSRLRQTDQPSPPSSCLSLSTTGHAAPDRVHREMRERGRGRKASKQALRNLNRELAGTRDDRLLRRLSIASDRRFEFTVELRNVLRCLRKKLLFLAL